MFTSTSREMTPPGALKVVVLLLLPVKTLLPIL
jgi:hypothetical protein